MRRDISGWSVLFDGTAASTYRQTGAWLDRTIADDAIALATSDPDRICLRDDRRAATSADIVREAGALAAGLSQLGLEPGQVISFQLPNWIEAAVINIAAAALGLVVNPIVTIYRDKETEDILRDCGARVLFVPATWRKFDHLAMANRLRASLPALEHIVAVRSDTPNAATLLYENLLATHPLRDWKQQDPDAVKFVMYTSGTTGRAKGVLHSHNSLSNALRGCMSFWRIANGEVILMPSPVTHVTGYLWGLEAPFVCGSPSVLMDRWDPREAVDLIDAHDVALTVSATPFLVELLDAAKAAGSRLPSLKAFGCGGASVPPDLVRRAHDNFANGSAFRVYGTTEVPMLGRGFPDTADKENAAETDGKIMGFEVRFVGDDGSDVPDQTEGEIIARGPARFLGYVDTAETANSVDANGYFHTGDLGRRTADGAIVITGRKKDLINRGGEKLAAREIEEILQRHPGILEVAAVAMPHRRLGETVCVFVIARGQPPTLADLVGLLESAGVARQKFPERLELAEDFPRTPAGKVRKDRLRTIIADRLRAEAMASQSE